MATNWKPECIQNGAPNFIEQTTMRLAAILGQLRDAAPDAEIIVMGAWDTFIGAFAFADPLFEALNAAIQDVGAAAQTRFANPFPIFNPQGDLDAETQAICTLTLLCTEGDSHPSDTGYQTLADVVFEVSGYARLLE